MIGNNGIITKSRDARDKTEQAKANEEADLLGLVGEIGDNLGELPSTTETKPYLPTGFSKVAGTNLDNGLVIQDSVGNQYVWVEVPMNATVYPTAGLGITTFDDTAYTNIENDLHTYTSTYRRNSWTDTYCPDTNNTGWFESADKYNEAKQKMLKSVYENGGFYVGRYETGIAYDDVNGLRSFGSAYSTLHEAKQTPVIKANAYPYNWVRRTQAKVLAESMYSGDRTSSLMFGVQWDLVLAFMHNKGEVADSTLTGDSKTIGNYKDNLWNVTNTSAKYSTDSGASWPACPKAKGESEASILLTTGADTSFGVMNIYDIAGNVWEWTLEMTYDTSIPCASRGGVCVGSGSSYPASRRIDSGTSFSSGVVGFRVSLY